MTSSLESISLSQTEPFAVLTADLKRCKLVEKVIAECTSAFACQGLKVSRSEVKVDQEDTCFILLRNMDPSRSKFCNMIFFLVSRCGRVLPDLDSLLASFEPTLRRWQRLPPEAIWGEVPGGYRA